MNMKRHLEVVTALKKMEYKLVSLNQEPEKAQVFSGYRRSKA